MQWIVEFSLIIFTLFIKVHVYHSSCGFRAYSRRLIKVLDAGPFVCLARSWNVKRTKQCNQPNAFTAPG